MNKFISTCCFAKDEKYKQDILVGKLYINKEKTIYIDFDRREIVKNHKPINSDFGFTPQMFRILECLVSNHDRIVTDDNFIDYIWNGIDHAPASAVQQINTTISKLKNIRMHEDVSQIFSEIISNKTQGLLQAPGYSFYFGENISIISTPQLFDKNFNLSKAFENISQDRLVDYIDPFETQKNDVIVKSESQNTENLINNEHPSKHILLDKIKSKKFLYVCIPVILAIAILSGAIFGINFTSFKTSQDVYHITVNKPKTFNDEDREILEQRVKIFADGEKYSIDFNEDKIEMYLPVSSFNDNEIEYVLDAYITNAINLYAINSKEQSLNDAIFIDRDAIESVNILNGPINGVDASEYGIGVSDYKYFSIILKDEFITKNSEALKKLGKNLAFAQDLDSDGWYYYHTFPQDDGKTFYVLNNDLSNNFINLLEFNLTHNSLSVDLSDYIVDINSKASWQNVSDINNAGVNQCNFDKFSEGTVTFSLSSYGNLSEGEGLDTEKALKQRLDVLGNPYAIGTCSTENETFYIIKTTTDNMSVPVMNLIGSTNSYILKGGLSEYWLGADSATLTKSSNGNKLSFIQSYYDDYEKEELMEFIKSLSESEQIYMYIDNMPLLSTDINNIDINTGTISFSNICQIQDGKIINESIDDYSYLLDLFNTISETSDNMESLTFVSYQFNVNKHGNLPTEKDFNLTYDYYDDEIANKVKSVCPSASVAMNNLELSVSLNLPVDDNLVSSSLEYSEAIYNAIDFENSIFQGISIYFINEDNSEMERGRIFFNKSYKTSYSEGYISTHGIFTNGRLEKYKDDFKEAVDNNNFISSFHQDEYA